MRTESLLDDDQPKREEETYTLRRATEVLGIDFKTLRKRMAHAGITPREDSVDRRVLLLTRDEVERLAATSRRAPTPPKADATLSRWIRAVKDLQATTDHLHAIVRQIVNELPLLRSKVARIDELELTVTDLRAEVGQHELKVTDLQAKIEQLERRIVVGRR